MQYGNPRCHDCGGKGYIRSWGGRMHKCCCVTPSPAVRAAIRSANTRMDRARMTVEDMIRIGSAPKGGADNGRLCSDL